MYISLLHALCGDNRLFFGRPKAAICCPHWSVRMLHCHSSLWKMTVLSRSLFCGDTKRAYLLRVFGEMAITGAQGAWPLKKLWCASLGSQETGRCQFCTVPAAHVKMCVINSITRNNFSIALTQLSEVLIWGIECGSTLPGAIYAWSSFSLEFNLSTGKCSNAGMCTQSLNKP